jgi:putative hydrolase of the HAD superfamily
MALTDSRRYTHLLFDLDHTLWDFEGNSRRVFRNLFEAHIAPLEAQLDPDRALDRYESINAELWNALRKGECTKAEVRTLRFERLLQEALPHVRQEQRRELSSFLEVDFVQRTPRETGLMPGALQAVQWASSHYSLHIITNGFPESQHTKVACSGLAPYFETVTTSEEVGAYKPAPEVFAAALAKASAEPEKTLVLGDGWEADILGAAAYGMDQVYYNPGKVNVPKGHVPTAVLHHWDELAPFLAGIALD